MTDNRKALVELVQKSGDSDFLRAVAEGVLQILMEADVEGLIGAGRRHTPVSLADHGSITATDPASAPSRPARGAQPAHSETAAESPAARLIGTPRKRTISAREVGHGRSNEPG